MKRFQEEAKMFGAAQAATIASARQIAAMQLACGIDLSAALAAGTEMKARLVRRVERVIERERLKGMRRHWSYDLNRHIALKQVLDRLRGSEESRAAADTAVLPEKARGGRQQNDARRRR
jgi:hypothetical protein